MRVPCYPFCCSDICHEKREAPPFQPAVHIHSPPEPRHAPEPNSSPLSAARSVFPPEYGGQNEIPLPPPGSTLHDPPLFSLRYCFRSEERRVGKWGRER